MLFDLKEDSLEDLHEPGQIHLVWEASETVPVQNCFDFT